MALGRIVHILLTFALVNSVSAVDPFGEQLKREDRCTLGTAFVDTVYRRMDELTKRLDAQQVQIEGREQPVAFTATFAAPDIQNLYTGEPLKFNRVLFNSGSGYNYKTGIFTAPSAGTYVFYLHIMKNLGHNDDVEVDLYKDTQLLVRAGACCSEHISGANMATVHLEEGQTMHLRLSRGSKLWGFLHSTFSGFKLSPN
ncbi:hypothetical protein BaRGS_00012030 [Batillaria attramentaria]|uniref:C1q domain-containing protein n=1 Tax=Batillaria attramentaria TaxID=370345 RepID=A0ABD0LBM0_9CAEN